MPTEDMQNVQRIVAVEEQLTKLNNRIIDCLNHLWAIGDHNLAWNHQEGDDFHCLSYCYVHLNGELHNQYKGEPVQETIFFKKMPTIETQSINDQ
jgi:hypothetical protein